ncbi:MAG: hypothetical protein ACKV2V_07710 [Blastocatellia bacterium]
MNNFDQINWEYWTGRLQELPATAAEWEGVQGFIDAVARIAKTKLSERNELRQKINARLEQLRTAHSVQLHEYGFNSDDWSELNCDLAEIDNIISQLDVFFDLLREDTRLGQQLPTLKQADFRQYIASARRRLDVAEGIYQYFRDLAFHFNPLEAEAAMTLALEDEGEEDEEIDVRQLVSASELSEAVTAVARSNGYLDGEPETTRAAGAGATPPAQAATPPAQAAAPAVAVPVAAVAAQSGQAQADSIDHDIIDIDIDIDGVADQPVVAGS